MGETAIEWTDTVWNPVRGCARVSPGCESCYAERQAHRFSNPGGPYEGLTVLGKHGPRWSGRARFVPETLDAPLRWRKPRRIFVNSMSDLFHHDITNEQIAAVFGVMAACPQHTFQVLTKRAERLPEWFRWVDEVPNAGADPEKPAWRWLRCVHQAQELGARPKRLSGHMHWPLNNVWLGVSAENQEWFDKRVPYLLRTPAAVRFVSAEPLLGPIDMRWKSLGQGSDCPEHGRMVRVDEDGCCVTCGRDATWYGLDWIIAGGESGPGARYCNVAWIRAIAQQCEAAKVPVFVKQLGARVIENRGRFEEHVGGSTRPYVDGARITEDGTVERMWWPTDRKGGDPSEWPEELRVRQFPRGA